MAWVIGLGYWAGAASLWLPMVLALNPHNAKQRGSDDLLAGIVLAFVWPVSAPVIALFTAARWIMHRWAGAPATSVLVRG
ncbi:MAG: hypothetical protein WD646_04685 [Actinomycetota bacterium]